MCRSSMGNHVCDIEDHTLLINKGDAQRDIRIDHPHAVITVLWKDEQHPHILTHRLSMHQTLHTRLLGTGDLGG